MLTAVDLRHRLPALRRHAWLLTGSRMAADAAVAVAIAGLPRDPAGRPQAADVASVWQAVQVAAGRMVCRPDPEAPPLLARLLALPMTQRRLLVARVVEGLPLEAAAEVAEVAPDEAAPLLAAARRGLMGHKPAAAMRMLLP